MGSTLEVLEPATEAVLAEIPRAGVEEADAKILELLGLAEDEPQPEP